MSHLEAMKQALEALKEIHVGNMTPMAETNWTAAITSLRQAIAEAEKQEPVGWTAMAFARLGMVRDKMHPDDVLTVQRFVDGDYTPPPQRQPLTVEQIADIVVEMNGNEPTALFWRDLARSIEAAHGIKD